MGVPKYDQAIKNSDIGRQLYDKWLRIHNQECCEEFRDYMSFYYWAIGSGFESGMTILRRDDTQPYGPDNCYWTMKAKQPYGAGTREWIDSWNATINRIRKAHGMEPLEAKATSEADDGKS